MKKLLLLCLLSVACFAQLTLDFDKNKELCDTKDDAKACTLAGSLYTLRNKPDYNKSMEYTVKGCDGKDASGCLSAGSAYFMGMGVKKDEAKAMQFYKKGCDLNDKLSCEMYKSNAKILRDVIDKLDETRNGSESDR